MENKENLDIEKSSPFDDLKICFSVFFKILDYNENDLGSFLSLKHVSNYNSVIFVKNLILIFYFISLVLVGLFSILKVWTYSLIFMIFALLVLILYRFIEKYIRNKYKYSISLYKKKRKTLLVLFGQLNLICNNYFLMNNEKYNEIRQNYDKISQKIDTFTNAIKPYSYHIKNFSFLIAISIPFLAFLLNLLNYINLNTIPEEIFSNIILIIVQCISGVDLLYLDKRLRIAYDKPFLEYHEIILFILLEIIRLKLRIIEFPEEEKFKLNLHKKMKEKKDLDSKHVSI